MPFYEEANSKKEDSEMKSFKSNSLVSDTITENKPSTFTSSKSHEFDDSKSGSESSQAFSEDLSSEEEKRAHLRKKYHSSHRHSKVSTMRGSILKNEEVIPSGSKRGSISNKQTESMFSTNLKHANNVKIKNEKRTKKTKTKNVDNSVTSMESLESMISIKSRKSIQSISKNKESVESNVTNLIMELENPSEAYKAGASPLNRALSPSRTLKQPSHFAKSIHEESLRKHKLKTQNMNERDRNGFSPHNVNQLLNKEAVIHQPPSSQNEEIEQENNDLSGSESQSLSESESPSESLSESGSLEEESDERESDDEGSKRESTYRLSKKSSTSNVLLMAINKLSKKEESKTSVKQESPLRKKIEEKKLQVEVFKDEGLTQNGSNSFAKKPPKTPLSRNAHHIITAIEGTRVRFFNNNCYVY